MALSGVQITIGASRSSLATAGVPSRVRQLDIIAAAGNSGTVYVGTSQVAATPLYAWIALAAGKSWGTKEDVEIDTANTYVVGTQSDIVHVSWIV